MSTSIRRRAEHGTDSGYYRHNRGTKTTPPTVPCEPCLIAHAQAEAARKERLTGKPTVHRRRNPQGRRCPDCGVHVARPGYRCRSCAALARHGVDIVKDWRLVNGVWTAA